MATFSNSIQERNLKHIELFDTLDADENAFKEVCKLYKHLNLSVIRDIRVGNEGKTLLHHVVRAGNMHLTNFLINNGHSVDVFDTSITKKTPLMEAIENNHIEIAALLVSSGADLCKQDMRDENALHYAAKSSCRMIRAIVKASCLDDMQLQNLASVTNVKLLFPEDLAQYTLVQNMLVYIREHGALPMRRKRQVAS